MSSSEQLSFDSAAVFLSLLAVGAWVLLLGLMATLACVAVPSYIVYSCRRDTNVRGVRGLVNESADLRGDL